MSLMLTTTSAVAESVGALLRQAREESGLTRQAVSARTRIPEKYLALIEENSSDLPDDAYSAIYLKAYAKFLGFETAAVTELYKKERGRTASAGWQAPSEGRKRQPHPATTLPTSAFVVTPKIIQSLLLATLVAGLALYFGLEIKKIIAPPRISLMAPPDGLVTAERSIIVEGRTEREVSLRINGKPVSPDGEGNFRDALELQEGLNQITIVGTKKHSKEMTVTRRIIVTPKERPTATMPLPVEPGL